MSSPRPEPGIRLARPCRSDAPTDRAALHSPAPIPWDSPCTRFVLTLLPIDMACSPSSAHLLLHLLPGLNRPARRYCTRPLPLAAPLPTSENSKVCTSAQQAAQPRETSNINS